MIATTEYSDMHRQHIKVTFFADFESAKRYYHQRRDAGGNMGGLRAGSYEYYESRQVYAVREKLN